MPDVVQSVIRVAIASAPEGGAEPRYDINTVLGIDHTGMAKADDKRNWGSDRYVYVRVEGTQEEINSLLLRKTRLDLSKILTPEEIANHQNYEWIVAQHHQDIFTGIATRSAHFNEEERQLLRIGQTVRPNMYSKIGNRELARAVFAHAGPLLSGAREKIATNRIDELTKPERIVATAFTDKKSFRFDQEIREKVYAEFKAHRDLITACETVAKSEIKNTTSTVNTNDKVIKLTGKILPGNSWEEIKHDTDLDHDPPPIIRGAGEPLPPSTCGSMGITPFQYFCIIDPTFTVGTGKTYSTIQDAIDAIIGNLSGQGIQTVEIYETVAGFYPENPEGDAGFIGAGASDYIHYKGMTPHNGIAGAGIIVQGQHPDASYSIFLTNAFSRIDDIAITQDSVNNATIIVLRPLGINYIIQRVLIYDIKSTGAGGNILGFAMLTHNGGAIYNSMVQDVNISGAGSWPTAFYIATMTSGVVYNCSVLNITGPSLGRGFWFFDAPITIRNCVVGDTKDDNYVRSSGANPDIQYCISEDGTANTWGGAGNQINKDPATDVKFVNVGSGTEDLHIQDGSVAIDAGVNLSPAVVDDIKGTHRPQGPAYDIGADEFIVAARRRKGLNTQVHLGTGKHNLKTSSKLGA